MSSAIILGICPEIIKISHVIKEPQIKSLRVTPLEGVSPNKKERLLPPPLLRTVRESFPSYGSSLL